MSVSAPHREGEGGSHPTAASTHSDHDSFIRANAIGGVGGGGGGSQRTALLGARHGTIATPEACLTPREGTAMTHTGLDVYEIAFLAGGPARVVDTALVVLVETGRVRVFAPASSPSWSPAAPTRSRAPSWTPSARRGTVRPTPSAGGRPATSGSPDWGRRSPPRACSAAVRSRARSRTARRGPRPGRVDRRCCTPGSTRRPTGPWTAAVRSRSPWTAGGPCRTRAGGRRSSSARARRCRARPACAGARGPPTCIDAERAASRTHLTAMGGAAAFGAIEGGGGDGGGF